MKILIGICMLFVVLPRCRWFDWLTLAPQAKSIDTEHTECFSQTSP